MRLLNSLFLVIILLLSACGGYPNTPSDTTRTHTEFNFDKEVFDKGGKAYVVIEAKNNAGAPFTVYNYLKFKDKNGDTYELQMKNDQPYSFLFTPGTYTITGYRLYGSKSAGYVRSIVDLDFTGLITGEFTVKAGEAIYLGQAVMDIIHARHSFFFKTTPKDLMYDIKIVNRFDKLTEEQLEFFKKESGLTLKPRPMSWRKKE